MNFLRIIGNLLRFDRANWKAVMLCFLTATVFWLFNAFNKDYSTNVRFPLHFEYNRGEFIPVSALPHQININVTGKGWDLFRNLLGLKLPEITIPLDRPKEIKKIVGASLPPLIQPQLGKLHINYLITDTLHVSIDEKDSHRYKVAVTLTNFSFRKGFGRISPIVILPDSVTLEGPKSVLHEMPDSISLAINAEKIDQNFNEDFEVIVANSDNVRRDPPIVKVLFEVGSVIEKKMKIRVKLSSLSLFDYWPDSAHVWFRIPSNRAEDFELLSKDISIFVDAKKLRGVGKVIPKVLAFPTYAELIKVDTIQYKSINR